PLIVTLAVGQIVLAVAIRYSREVTGQAAVPSSLSSWAQEKPLGISSVFWTGAALTLAVALALRYTAPGRRFQAVGANPRAAWMAGLHVRSHVVFAYTAAGVLYGVAAVLLAGLRISIDPAFGASYLLAPIAAVVIAGASLSGGLGPRSPPAAGRWTGGHPTRSHGNHELRLGERRHDAGSEGIRSVTQTPAGRGHVDDPRPRCDAGARLDLERRHQHGEGEAGGRDLDRQGVRRGVRGEGVDPQEDALQGHPAPG